MRFAVPLALFAALIVVDGCSQPPAPRPAPPVPVRPVPLPTPAPAPPAGTDWSDWPITPGTWTYRADGRGSIALFGTAGADAAFTIRCDKGANAVILSRAGDTRGTGMTLRTTTATRTLPTQPAGGALPYIAAVLGPDDRLLDAIGFSRGRFAVDAPPMATLIIPAWAEILRVVEDCRG